MLIHYQAYIKKLIGFFDDISFHHIPREENQMADTLATLASMFQLTPHGDLSYIELKCRGKPTHCYLIEEEQDGKPWYFDMKRYIEDKEYPQEAFDNDKRMLQRLVASFFLSGNILYKRNHDMVLLRCVDAREVEKMLVEVHEGSFGTHAMARKILRQGVTGSLWKTIVASVWGSATSARPLPIISMLRSYRWTSWQCLGHSLVGSSGLRIIKKKGWINYS